VASKVVTGLHLLMCSCHKMSPCLPCTFMRPLSTWRLERQARATTGHVAVGEAGPCDHWARGG